MRLPTKEVAFSTTASLTASALLNLIASKFASGSAAAVFTCSLSWEDKENKALLLSELRSSALLISLLTLETASTMVVAICLNESALPTPDSSTLSAALLVIVSMALVSVKSKTTTAFGFSLAASPFSWTISATDAIASRNESSLPAPVPSTAEEIAVTVVITWCATFSTAKAISGSASSEKALNCVGSTPSGKPSTAPTSAAFNPVASIMVVVGEITDEPLGAFKITSDKTSPDEVSIVFSSVLTVKEKPSLPSSSKVPSSSVYVKGSPELSCPSRL